MMMTHYPLILEANELYVYEYVISFVQTLGLQMCSLTLEFEKVLHDWKYLDRIPLQEAQ
jgi:sorbitol-specific phosphotransferase system component IIC